MHWCHLEHQPYNNVELLGWETLETRRKLLKNDPFVQDEKIILYFHTCHVFLPLCFPEFTAIPYIIHTIAEYQVPTSRYKRAFLPPTVSLGNQLLFEINSLTDLSMFKRVVKCHLFHHDSPAPWLAGERAVSIFHTRLCLDLSGLKAHLFTHGFSQNALCECGH